MVKRINFLFSLLAVFTFLLAACTTPSATTQAPVPTQAPAPTEPPAPTQPPAPAGNAALKVTGMVTKEMAWTEAEIKAMKTLQVEATNKKGEKQTYTGVLIADLLKLASPSPDAKTLVLVGDDGYTAEVALADVMACTNCIVSFRDQGGFSSVMPDYPSNVQVKGIIEIKVK